MNKINHTIVLSFVINGCLSSIVGECIKCNTINIKMSREQTIFTFHSQYMKINADNHGEHTINQHHLLIIVHENFILVIFVAKRHVNDLLQMIS